MDKTQVVELLRKYNEGIASKEEVNLLENWYAHELGLQELNLEEEDYLEINSVMWKNIQRTRKLRKPRVVWYRIAAAAVLLLCIGIAFYRYQPEQEVKENQSVVQDFAPGKTGATLTLANGKRIVLTDAEHGKIANQGGVEVNKAADGSLIYSSNADATNAEPVMNLLTTAKSEHYKIVLPDGSKVWLNAASSLKFPTNFDAQGNRKVELVGEAYFEVKEDRTHPFIVSTEKQNVEVLGTHFNINSYHDETSIKTTLLEGSVKVVSGLYNHETLLKVNQQSILDKTDDAINVKKVDIEAVIAWKNGLFQFENADIQTVMRQLSRWYDIDIKYVGDIPKERFSGKVYRNMSLSKVLDVLSFSQINFQIKGRRMTIHPNDNK